MEQDRLAVIGAGEAAFPILNKAKGMDVQTVVFGQKGSLAEDLADIFVDKDIFDVEGILEECKRYQVNGVIASSEISTEVAAVIADALGLPGNDISKGFAGRNKYRMRCRVQQLDSVKQPAFELYQEGKEYQLPVVVKAVDSCGKRGVCLASTQEQLKVAVEDALKYSTDGSALIEEYLVGGQEYSIECLAANGESRIIQYTQKDSSGAPHFAEIGHHQPATLTDVEKDKIDLAIRDILRVLGINCGMAHAEVKIINGVVYFIEVGARAGGDHIADVLLGISTDFDYFKGAIECSLGKFVFPEIHNVAHAGMYYYCKQNEYIESLFDCAAQANWCFQNSFTKHELYEVSCNTQAMGSGFLIYASDEKIDENTYKDAHKTIAVEINNFPNAYQLIWNHNKEIGRDLSDEELDKGIKKFLDKAHVLGIVRNNHVQALSVLYCNEVDTLNAYICNVYVLGKYRKSGYASNLVQKSIEICKRNKFKTISLHVDPQNVGAVKLYENFGFKLTGETKMIGSKLENEMKLSLDKEI